LIKFGQSNLAADSQLGETRSIDIHGNENVTMSFLDIKERDHGGEPSGRDHRQHFYPHRRLSGLQKGKERPEWPLFHPDPPDRRTGLTGIRIETPRTFYCQGEKWTE
jgi:hypothetical protein